MRRLAAFFLLPVLIGLAGCYADLEEHVGSAPSFDITRFFNGDLEGWGRMESYLGEPDHRFMMDMHADWQGQEGRLHEVFHMDNGETTERSWALHLIDVGHFTGTTSNVVGEMTGRMVGNAVHMDFTQTFIRADGTPVDLTMDDTIVLIDARHALDHIALSKHGIPVGFITVAFRKS